MPLIPKQINRCCGFQNENNLWIVPPIFEELKMIDENRALICYKNKYGIFDLQEQKIVVSFLYDCMFQFRDGISTVILNQKRGAINLQYEEIIPLIYDNMGQFKNGIIDVCIKNKWGAVNLKNELVIPFEYDNLGSFDEFGMCIAQLNRKFGLISLQNEVKIPFIYDRIMKGNHGFYRVKIGLNWGMTNANHEFLLEVKYRDVFTFDKNIAVVVSNDGYKKYGAIDTSGNWVLPMEYDGIHPFFDQTFIVSKDSKEGIIDDYGNYVIPLIYDRICGISLSNNLFKVKKDGRYGMISLKNEEIIPFEYDKMGEFSEGMLNVCKGNKFGYVDLKNQVLIDFQFAFAGKFKNGLSKVKIHNDKRSKPNWTYINSWGCFPDKYKFSYVDDFHSDFYANVKKEQESYKINNSFQVFKRLKSNKLWL